MKTLDAQIALAAREGVRRALGLPSDFAVLRIDRRGGSGMRRGGRGGSGTRADVIDPNGDGTMYGLTGFSPPSYMVSGGGGGEAGVGTGFLVATLIRPQALTAGGTNVLVARSNAAITQGHYTRMDGTGLFNFFLGVDATTKTAPNVNVRTLDLGRVHLLISYLDATSMGMWLDRVKGATTAIVNPATYLPAPSPNRQTLGLWEHNPAQHSRDVDILAVAAFRGLPSDAQVQAYCDATRALGDLPDVMGGAVCTHHESVKRELSGVSNPVGRKTYGARNWSAADHYATAEGATTGIVGAVSGFFVQARHKIESVQGAGNRFFAMRGDAAGSGYVLEQAVLTFRVRMGNGSGAVYSPSFTFSAADIGRTVLITGVLDTPNNVLRFYCDGVEVGPATSWAGMTYSVPSAVSGFTGKMLLGRWWGGGPTDGNSTIFQVAGGHFVPTAAALLAQARASEEAGTLIPLAGSTHHYDIDADVKASGVLTALPTTITDRIVGGNSPLTKAGTGLELAVDIAKAPPCPAQLTDTVTRAPVDALARVGAPQVVTIDPTIDGRRLLGAQGWSGANFLSTASPGGIIGSASAFWVEVPVRFDSIPTASQMIAHNLLPNSAATGWGLQAASNVLRVLIGNGAATVVSSGYTITAADIGVPLLALIQYTGSVVRLYFRRVQQGADVTTVFAPANLATQIGQWNGSQTFVAGSVFGLQGGNGNLTLAEIQERFDRFDAVGRLEKSAKADHLYDLTADILASGVDEVPAVVLDRVGTDHLTKVGIDVQTGPNAIRGVGPYGAPDGWVTSAGGGIHGANAGFHIGFDLYLTKIPTAREFLALCADSGIATTGWYADFTPPALRFVIVNVQSSSTYTITAADLNKRLRVVMQKTATQLQLFVQGVQVGADAAAATIATSASNAMRLGNLNNANSFSCGWIENVHGGNTVLTPAEITAQSANLTAAPPATAGKTQKRWLFEQDIAAVNGALPARSVERISGGDDMVRIGSGLTLAQRTERLWSYETSPIYVGANALTDADYYAATLGQGPGGHAAGWWYALPFVCDSQAVSGGSRVVAGRNGGTIPGGFDLRTVGVNSSLTPVVCDAGGTFRTAPAGSIVAADVGKLLLYVLMWDASQQKLRGFLKRAEIGTGLAMTGFSPAAADAPFTVGRHPTSGGLGAAGIRVLGGMYGVGVLSPAEVFAMHDALLAKEELIEVPGKTDFRFWLTTDARNNGGALPAVVQDLKGTAHLSRVGAPATAPIYARAAA